MFRLVIRIFCLLTHTFLAHLTWLVSQRWSVASSLNQVFARKQHSQEASVCACVCKIHISLMTENVDSGRLGPALCSDTSEPRHTDRVWTVDAVVGEGLPRLLLKLHQWVHTSGCAGSAVQLMDAEHQIQVYIQEFEWGGWADLSRSALNPVICKITRAGWPATKVPVDCWKLNQFQVELTELCQLTVGSAQGPVSQSNMTYLWAELRFSGVTKLTHSYPGLTTIVTCTAA